MKESALALLLFAFSGASLHADDVEVNRAMLALLQPLPEVAENPENPLTEVKVDLGRKLYYDTRLSKNRTVSCNTCHDLANFGDDGLALAKGIHGHIAPRSSPTVYNAALGVAQFWDGRAKDVEEQATGPVLASGEMGMPDGDSVVKLLQPIPGYVDMFEQAFPEDEDPVTFTNLGKAIGAFERKLLTPAPFDAFVKGDEDALTNEQKHGLNVFLTTGCATCHNGAGIGGHMFQKLGLVKEWPTEDLGRYEVTKNEAEKYFFKVPTLRNVIETGPYLHDGSVETIEEIVAKMAEYQLGRELSDEDVNAIVDFLGSLTGKIDPEIIAVPELPEDGPDTPKGDS